MPFKFCLCGCKKASQDEPSNPTDGDPYENIEGEKATFGMNTMWTAEAKMGRILGVIRTRVGYVGGTEVVEVEFDKHHTTYAKLLEVFWQSHDRCGSFERKNLSVIFYHNLEQKTAAELSLINQIPKWKDPILTEILPVDDFKIAPEPQQKYFLHRHRDILPMLKLDSGEKVIKSHIACRLNGFLAGYGSLNDFDSECRALKLPEDIVTFIRTKVEEVKVAETLQSSKVK